MVVYAAHSTHSAIIMKVTYTWHMALKSELTLYIGGPCSSVLSLSSCNGNI